MELVTSQVVVCFHVGELYLYPRSNLRVLSDFEVEFQWILHIIQYLIPDADLSERFGHGYYFFFHNLRGG